MAITFSKESNDMVVNVLKDENGTTLKFSNEAVVPPAELEPLAPAQNAPDPAVGPPVEPEPVVESPKSPVEMSWDAETDSDDSEDDYLPEPKKQSKAPSWTKEEDEILLNARKTTGSWVVIAKKLPGRTDRACRAYYERTYGSDEVLSKKKKKTKPPPPLPEEDEPPKKKSRVRWTKEEDNVLTNARKNWVLWQSKWTDIDLPRRTVSAMKTRWNEIKNY